MQKFTLKSRKGKFILIATVLASGMAFLLGTMVSIALPTIQEVFSASIAEIQWVLNAYVLQLAVLILLAGSLSDYFGTKKVFLSGIFIFTLGSVLSALAQSALQLIVFQAIQGVGAALMIPGSLSIINTTFTENIRGAVIGYWAGLAGALAAFGPLLGGWLVDTFGWPYVFWFNIPVGILAFLCAWKFIPRTRVNREEKLNIKSAFFAAIALFGISFALIQGPSAGWMSRYVLLSFLFAVFSGLSFVASERKSRAPLIPVEIFKKKLILGANLSTFFLYFALNGVIVFMVFNLQQVQNYTPLDAGLALLPITLIISFFAGAAGKITDKIGPRMQVITGPAFVGIGIGLLLRLPQDAEFLADILPSFLLIGSGMAFVIAAITKSALSVAERHSGAASGVNNAVSRVAALFAFALLAVPFALHIYAFFALLAVPVAYFTIYKKQQDIHPGEPRLQHHLLHHP